jgi:hypothetical protein
MIEIAKWQFYILSGTSFMGVFLLTVFYLMADGSIKVIG